MVKTQRSCRFKNDLFLCLCYNIPSGSSREVFSESNVFDLILDYIFLFENTYGQCNLVITGDFNARVGTQPDIVEHLFFTQTHYAT